MSHLPPATRQCTGGHICPPLRESGQAAVEMALTIMLLIIFFGGVMTIGPIVYTHLAILTVSNDCATAAAQTLDAEQGHYQGVAAAQESLAGFRLRQGAASVNVAGTWERGTPVTCTVGYDVDLSGIPAASVFTASPHVEYAVVLPAQDFKSAWR